MPLTRSDQHRIPTVEIPGGLFCFESQPGAPLQQADPLPVLLVVPKPRRAARFAGMDALKPESRQLQQQVDPLRPRRWTFAAQQVLAIAFAARLFPPATADLESPLPRQAHHLLMVPAVLECLTQLRPLLAERHKCIQLGDLGQELLQIGFGHGQPLDVLASTLIHRPGQLLRGLLSPSPAPLAGRPFQA